MWSPGLHYRPLANRPSPCTVSGAYRPPWSWSTLETAYFASGRQHRFSAAPLSLICSDGEAETVVVARWAYPAWGVARVRKGPRSVSVRKSKLRVAPVPLIGQLSNRQFVTHLRQLATESSQPVSVRVRTARQNCSCGCGQPVAERRKFVNQEHYSTWWSQLRYFGRNRRARP
jgi:hypothetical protein